MDAQITGAMIQAAGTVIAAIIGSASLLAIALHRNNIIRLAKSTEAYYQIEAEWVKKQLKEQGNTNPTEQQIKNMRGKLRSDLMGKDHSKRSDFMNSREALKIRSKYLSFDS